MRTNLENARTLLVQARAMALGAKALVTWSQDQTDSMDGTGTWWPHQEASDYAGTAACEIEDAINRIDLLLNMENVK